METKMLKQLKFWKNCGQFIQAIIINFTTPREKVLDLYWELWDENYVLKVRLICRRNVAVCKSSRKFVNPLFVIKMHLWRCQKIYRLFSRKELYSWKLRSSALSFVKWRRAPLKVFRPSFVISLQLSKCKILFENSIKQLKV